MLPLPTAYAEPSELALTLEKPLASILRKGLVPFSMTQTVPLCPVTKTLPPLAPTSASPEPLVLPQSLPLPSASVYQRVPLVPTAHARPSPQEMRSKPLAAVFVHD